METMNYFCTFAPQFIINHVINSVKNGKDSSRKICGARV